MNRKILSALTTSAVLLTQPVLFCSAAQGQLPSVRPSLTLLDDHPAEPGFTRLFNGKDLTGWEGNPRLW